MKRCSKRSVIVGFLALTVVALMFIWSNRQPIASQSLPEIVTGFTPKGWQIFDEIKQFMPENLYEQVFCPAVWSSVAALR